MRIGTGQKWKARVGKPAILNLGHLVKSEWEEELSTAVMRQFGRDWTVFVEFTELRVRIVGLVGRLPCVFL